uniref:GRF10 n=1 Tax=Arundo donax TaxID=35708 RepID=A0A0A9G4H3_ARUDO
MGRRRIERGRTAKAAQGRRRTARAEIWSWSTIRRWSPSRIRRKRPQHFRKK